MAANDRWLGIIITGIGALMLYQVYTLEFPVFLDDPGPKLMPGIVGVLLVVCGLGHLLWPKAKGKVEKKAPLNKAAKTKILYVGIAVIVYVLLMEFTGYILSTFLFLTFMIWFLSENKNKLSFVKSGIVSIMITLAVYFIFEQLIGIILPEGIF